MPDDIVELVAVAIVNGDWEELPDLHKVLALSQARAALSAIRETHAIVPRTPTEAMVAAVVQQVGDPTNEQWALAEKTVDSLTGPSMEGDIACAEVIRDYQAMISAAEGKGS